MKVGDMVYHRDRDGTAALLGDGLIIDKWEEWGVAGSRRARRQGWTVLWSTNAVFNHHTYELQVLHESG